MPDKTIIADKLQKIEETLQLLLDGTANYCQNIRKFLGMLL